MGVGQGPHVDQEGYRRPAASDTRRQVSPALSIVLRTTYYVLQVRPIIRAL